MCVCVGGVGGREELCITAYYSVCIKLWVVLFLKNIYLFFQKTIFTAFYLDMVHFENVVLCIFLGQNRYLRPDARQSRPTNARTGWIPWETADEKRHINLLAAGKFEDRV